MGISDTEYDELMELCHGGRLYVLTTGEEVPTTLRDRIVNLLDGAAGDQDILQHVRKWGPAESARKIAKKALEAGQIAHAREFLWAALLYDEGLMQSRRLSAAHAALAEGRLEQAATLLSKPCWKPL
jgi:hypothetical protein